MDDVGRLWSLTRETFHTGKKGTQMASRLTTNGSCPPLPRQESFDIGCMTAVLSWDSEYMTYKVPTNYLRRAAPGQTYCLLVLSLIHISEPTRLLSISYAV